MMAVADLGTVHEEGQRADVYATITDKIIEDVMDEAVNAASTNGRCARPMASTINVISECMCDCKVCGSNPLTSGFL
jgi:hypothetical protein